MHLAQASLVLSTILLVFFSRQLLSSPPSVLLVVLPLLRHMIISPSESCMLDAVLSSYCHTWW
jgi:hypothetical protein